MPHIICITFTFHMIRTLHKSRFSVYFSNKISFRWNQLELKLLRIVFFLFVVLICHIAVASHSGENSMGDAYAYGISNCKCNLYCIFDTMFLPSYSIFLSSLPITLRYSISALFIWLKVAVVVVVVDSLFRAVSFALIFRVLLITEIIIVIY